MRFIPLIAALAVACTDATNVSPTADGSTADARVEPDARADAAPKDAFVPDVAPTDAFVELDVQSTDMQRPDAAPPDPDDGVPPPDAQPPIPDQGVDPDVARPDAFVDPVLHLRWGRVTWTSQPGAEPEGRQPAENGQLRLRGGLRKR